LVKIDDREETPKIRFAKQVSGVRDEVFPALDPRCCERFTCAGASEGVCAFSQGVVGIAPPREGWAGACDEGNGSGGHPKPYAGPTIFPHSFCRGRGPWKPSGMLGVDVHGGGVGFDCRRRGARMLSGLWADVNGRAASR